jgi:hypothetical protein
MQGMLASRLDHSFSADSSGVDDIRKVRDEKQGEWFISTEDWRELGYGKCLLENTKGEVPAGRAHSSC